LVWCDKLASTPAVGFALDPHLAPTSSILAALAPVLEEWVVRDTDKVEFTVDRTADPFSLQITSNTGFLYAITHSRIWVEFIHKMKLRPTSGGPPIAELTSQPLPFTVLMPEISRRLIEATMLLPNIGTRNVRRIGIVSTTVLDEATMPPGIARFVRYMSRPWQGAVENYQFMIASELSRGSQSVDKCIHTVLKSDDAEQLPVLKFDWQRWFDPPSHPVRKESITTLLRNAEDTAMTYFEELAEGNRFDENLLRSST